MRLHIVTASLLALAAGGQDGAQQPPRFRTGVEVVLLDVTVLDRQRRPLRGLTREDFTILEDDAQQRIVSFEELSAPEPDGALVPWMREIGPDVRTNTDDHRRLVLIVLSDATISFRNTPDVKEIGRKVIDQLGPADLAAIVFTGNNARSQDFTNDRRVLRAAIDRYVDTLTAGLGGIYAMRTMRKAVDALAEIPHRRKAMIVVGGSLQPRSTAFSRSSPLDTSGSINHELQETIKRAQRANVTIYTVSPRGLLAPRPDTTPEDLSLDELNGEVNETGGFRVSNTNDFGQQLRQIFRETGSYYLLGFESAHTDGKFRRLQVKVNRPGVTVRTRNGYTARRPERADGDKRAEGPDLPLVKALSGILPAPDMPMRVTVAPFATPGKKTATLAIVLGFRHPAPSAGTSIVDKVDVMSRAFDTDGRPRGAFRQVAELKMRATGAAEARYEVFSRLELTPGRYQLRFAVHSASLGKSGSIYS